jgi:hypothetical protein
MLPSEPERPVPPPSPRIWARLRSADWRAWLALAWAVWFGTLYLKMTVERRGGKLRAVVSQLARSLESTHRATR